MRLWRNYLRWRHSKGFGVHSPFAYRFVRDVINPGKYGHYALDELDRLSEVYHISDYRYHRFIDFLIRVLIFLDIKCLIGPSENTPTLKVASKCVGINFIQFKKGDFNKFKKGDMLYAERKISPATIKSALQHGVPVLVSNPVAETRKILSQPLERGLLFDWKNMLLLIPRQEMAYVRYEV